MSYARGIADRGSSLLQIYLQANFLRSRRRGVCVCMTQVLYALHLLLAKNTLSQKRLYISMSLSSYALKSLLCL